MVILMQIKKWTNSVNVILGSVFLVLLLAGCGASGSSAPASDAASGTPAADPLAGMDTTGLSEDALADLTYLAGVGPVGLTEDGTPTVLVTVSAGMVGDETQSQEDLDARAGENYIRATLGDDYSITYQLTRPQYETMRSVIAESLERSLEGMITGKNYNFSEIRHDDHFAVFDVTLSGRRSRSSVSIIAPVFTGSSTTIRRIPTWYTSTPQKGSCWTPPVQRLSKLLSFSRTTTQ